MEKEINKNLDNFLSDDENTDEKKNKEKKNQKELVLKSRSGLIERIDRKIITEDGRQLLREHY